MASPIYIAGEKIQKGDAVFLGTDKKLYKIGGSVEISKMFAEVYVKGLVERLNQNDRVLDGDVPAPTPDSDYPNMLENVSRERDKWIGQFADRYPISQENVRIAWLRLWHLVGIGQIRLDDLFNRMNALGVLCEQGFVFEQAYKIVVPMVEIANELSD